MSSINHSRLSKVIWIWKLSPAPLNEPSSRTMNSPLHLRDVVRLNISIECSQLFYSVVRNRTRDYIRAGCPLANALPSVVRDLIEVCQ